MTETKITPRFKTKYAEVVVPALQEEFKYENVMQTPKIVKVVVNMGVGEAARDAKLMDGAIRDLTAITGQKPIVTRAKKSIAQFKLREGMPIGAHVTLRGDRMWEFLDRLVTLALPRIRDFRDLRSDRAVHVPRNRSGLDRPRAWYGHHRGDLREDRRRRPCNPEGTGLPVQDQLTTTL